MTLLRQSILLLTMLAFLTGLAAASGGTGKLKLDAVILDEEGNESVNYRTFNEYEGAALSLEGFRYNFDNGMRIMADLNRITMNNRNMRLRLDQPGLFGVELSNNQYRRVYSFDGDKYTRRHRSSATAWVFPHRYVRLYAGLSNIGRTGDAVDLFRIGPSVVDAENAVRAHDFQQLTWRAGAQLNYEGRALHFEYRGTDFQDDINTDRDQDRHRILVTGQYPLPLTEQTVVLSGGYQRFETKFTDTDFGIVSDRAWGGVVASLKSGLFARYNLVFDRSASDSDLVQTDNLANAFYVGYIKRGQGGATVGYQRDVNDDYNAEVNANTFYFSGWLKPMPHLEFKGEVGSRSETVDDGSRLVGDEDRVRLRVSGKYRVPMKGAVSLRFDVRNRKNDQLNSEVDFDRIIADANYIYPGYGMLSVGYSFATGEYQNQTDEPGFDFDEHQLYGEVETEEYENVTAGFGAIYYRSREDIDVESFTLRFSAEYRFLEDYRFGVVYNVHNFDDFLVLDQYYTANIVEISISKDITF
jgi:hypothetical protein